MEVFFTVYEEFIHAVRFRWETAWWIKEEAPLLNMNTDSSLHSICLHLVPEWIIHSYNLLTGTFKWWMTGTEPSAAAEILRGGGERETTRKLENKKNRQP